MIDSDPSKMYDYRFVQEQTSFKGSNPEVQRRRVDNLGGHAVVMLEKLHAQNVAVADKVDGAFHDCLTQIQDKQSALRPPDSTTTVTTPKEIRAAAKTFKKEMKGFEKSIAKALHTYQIAVLKEQAKADYKDLTEDQGKQIEQLAKGGIRAFWIRTKALFSSSDKKIVSVFTSAHKKMVTASKAGIKKLENETEVQKSQRNEFEKYRDHGTQKRGGVLSVGHTFRFVPSFREDKILKQFQSFCAQRQSLTVRTTIKKKLSDVTIGMIRPVTSTLTPLNQEFDRLVSAPGSTFGAIHGKAGSSSAHREGHHLSNAYLSELSVNEETVDRTYYQAIRHAILSSNPKETNKQQRKEDAQIQAKELLTAAVMKDLKKYNGTLPPGYQPTIISTSLVTPFIISGGERQMWDDQREALSAMNGKPTSIKIGDKWISVTPKIHAFNFGVNKGAVKFGLGAIKQYFQNRRAIRALEKSTSQLLKINEEDSPDISLLKKRTLPLLQDIQRLTRTPWSYLGNGNQYEVGAKLVCLANMLDKIQGGYTGTINCKSAKDRTQILDAVAKTFMTMYEKNGTFPSSEELKTDENLRKQFKEIFATMVKESGGLEITEINTGALGLKVDEMILLCGFSLEELCDIQGTSATAGA